MSRGSRQPAATLTVEARAAAAVVGLVVGAGALIDGFDAGGRVEPATSRGPASPSENRAVPTRMVAKAGRRLGS